MPSAPPPNRHVLVAEDDRVTREYVAGLLRGHGYRVTSVENGKKALDRVLEGEVSVAILDVVMEGLSGVDVCRMIKSATAQRGTFLPVVLLTARSDVDSRVEGLRIGADDYVCKPFDERELIARVEGMLRIKDMHDEVARARERLERLAIRDELTGLYNYRYLQSRLDEEFKRAERYREPLSCAMIDIDHFKTFNDRFGHDVGDTVLRTIAERLLAAVREVDVVARYGGEEFLLVLPSTHLAGALTVADRVWRAVGDQPVALGDSGSERITVSVGVALYPSRGVTGRDALLKAADRALYRAKEEGRDRICVFSEATYVYEQG
ncbi:MAG: diguanylate cyclase [Sandaracinaceae bacterium]|nr:diguanylate cyclase [Sandaracinaceae bacterium]